MRKMMMEIAAELKKSKERSLLSALSFFPLPSFRNKHFAKFF
jgi:hypothetical protein